MKPLPQHIIEFCDDKVAELTEQIAKYVNAEQYRAATILTSQIEVFEEVRGIVSAYCLVETLTDFENDEFQNQ